MHASAFVYTKLFYVKDLNKKKQKTKTNGLGIVLVFL